ncbi:MAG: HlyC/CorC family transporter [Clostridia bacterium]|nr:HlyC/CorC family transporter [Clostridia bacterium]
MSVVLKLALLFVLILVNAFFSMSEIAIISLNDNKIRKMAEDGHKKAKKILKLTEESSSFLSTIQVGVTLAGFLTSASASQNFADILNHKLVSWFSITDPTGKSVIYGVSVVVITLITSYFSLVLGELVPKKIAMQKAERVSFAVVGPLLTIKALLRPVIAFLSVSTNGLVRLFGIDPNANLEEVTEEEIRMLVDVGEEKGVIEESQREMINNIFEFDDIDVSDVMRHRTEISAVEITDDLNAVIQIAIEEGYSRIPVFKEDLDNIVGIIYIKDLLKFIGKRMPDGGVARDVMRRAYHVPESKRCGELFKEMTEKRIQMAVVVDEYGGTAGLVTLEDLIESILGNIQDEYDDEDEEIQKVNDTTFTIDGMCDIEEVAEMLGTELPEGDYDTLGGLILSILGRIPTEGENPVVECSGYRFTVETIDERRIDTVKAEKLPEPQSQEDED